MRNTKIVATLGPASSSPEAIEGLVKAGVNVFRLNFSHGTHENHRQLFTDIVTISAELERQTAVMADLQGPKIRLGQFEESPLALETGAPFTITTKDCVGNREIGCTVYSAFARDVVAGDRVLINDGAVELRVLETDGISARCLVVSGGLVGNNKGINLPGVNVSAPSLTKKDVEDLDFALNLGVDLVALSFVRRAENVLALRDQMKRAGIERPIVAKIEKAEAWQNIDAILDATDGVMVARGDLGVEMAPERVPFIQKGIIYKARQKRRFVITATQMLESMIENPSPTRAEVSDVANAIYDGTDAVMLSGETAVGKYPSAAVQMMVRIATETEPRLKLLPLPSFPVEEERRVAEIVADLAQRAAVESNAVGIVVFTSTGRSALLIARNRPLMPIFAFTHVEETARSLTPVWGVVPFIEKSAASTDEMMMVMDRRLREAGVAKPGDIVVFVSGQPIAQTGTTNMMKIHKVTAS